MNRRDFITGVAAAGLALRFCPRAFAGQQAPSGSLTHRAAVETSVELVLGAGAKKVIVIDNTTNQAKRCYVRSGIQEAVKQAGGDMLFVDDYRVKKTALKGVWIKEWEVVLAVVQSDKLINVPIAKHHSLCRLSLGMKNWLGATGGGRNPFHH